MPRLVENRWTEEAGLRRAEILSARQTPEGFDVVRVQALRASGFDIPPSVGHYLSVLSGAAISRDDGLRFDRGTHVYIPPGASTMLEIEPTTEFLLVSAERPEQATRFDLEVRHERFLAASAHDRQSLRWILTPQYLSRRVFLHHDAPLRSREGRPVSWFRTTMFDVAGLPENEDGESVFRMSYDTRTEFNVLYDVSAGGRVRFANHPYVPRGQSWSAWHALHSNVTYHLDEPAGGEAEETYVDDAGITRSLRNRHEVWVPSGGHCSLLCLFDPAPTGVERHRPGAFSDYEALEDVRQRAEHARHIAAIGPFDDMVRTLSMAHAGGSLDTMHDTEQWARYTAGRAEQRRVEQALHDTLRAAGAGRAQVIAPWMLSVDADAPPP